MVGLEREMGKVSCRSHQAGANMKKAKSSPRWGCREYDGGIGSSGSSGEPLKVFLWVLFQICLLEGSFWV